MGVYPLPWAAPAMLEANRFWFYSLAISTFLSLYQFFNVPSTPPTTINFSAVAYNEETETKEKTDVEDEKKLAETLAKHRRGLKWKYAKEAVMYGGDLLLPGAATGWILTSPTYVAGAMVVTTLLGLEGIWKRVNAAET